MDFNVKKLASGAGLFFTRAVQFTEEKLGQAEKTELDAQLENLMRRADVTKQWTEKIFRQTEVLLQPSPIDHTGARIEEFLYEKLDKKPPYRTTNGEFLGQYMEDAGQEFDPGTPYGGALMAVGQCERTLGEAEREFVQTSAISYLTPLRNFLEGDWRTISKERRFLENLRLDLDASKARLKKARLAEARASNAPDFQETRPRNYVLSTSASALWSEEAEKRFNKSFQTEERRNLPFKGQKRNRPQLRAEHDLRLAQTEFVRQTEVVRLLLEGISSTQVNHLRCLLEFVEAQAAYYKRCHLHMQDLQKILGRSSNAFAMDSTHSVAPPISASEGGSSPVEVDTLKIEEVQAPATGTRKAKVLYDYDAADSSELSLLADELITVYTVHGMDSDWLVGEKGHQRGKVPVTYLELLS